MSSYSSSQDNSVYPAASVLTESVDSDTSPYNYWLGQSGAHIIFDLSCLGSINGVTLKNTRKGSGNDAGTKEFSLWTSDSATGSWTQITLTDGVMTTAIDEDPVTTQDVSFSTLSTQFVKFQVDGVYGTVGGRP